MKRFCTTSLILLAMAVVFAPCASAQVEDVTVRDINTISQAFIDSLNIAGESLTDEQIDRWIYGDFVADTVRFTAVVMSDPTLSGLASPNDDGLPGRLHVFLRDTSAASMGVEGMGIQIVDGFPSWQTNGLLALTVGVVIEVTGVVAPFTGDNVMQVAPLSVDPKGLYTDFGLPGSILDPVVISTSDAAMTVGTQGQVQANWENFSSLRAQYVRIEDAVIQRRDISSDRPSWTISSDGGVTQIQNRDVSLAYRNDRDGSYNEDQFRVFFDDFVPPPPGSGVNVQGFLIVYDFDPFNIGTPDGAQFYISPFERSDLEVTVSAPTVSNVSRPSSIVMANESVDITADVSADPTRSLATVELRYYTSAAPDTMSVAGTLDTGETYTFTIPGQPDLNFVTYWISAVDNIGAESQPINFTYRVGSISQISHIQGTVDGGPGDSPYVGMTVPMDITGTVYTTPDSSGFFNIQEPSLEPFSGILLRAEGDVLNLKNSDTIDITEAEVEEVFGVTQLRNVTFTVAGTGAATPHKTLTTTALVDQGIAEQHEGMLVRLENVTIISNDEGFGEWSFSSDGTAENKVKADDASNSDAIGSSFATSTFTDGEVYSFIQGLWWFSFSEYKLVPEVVSDIGEVTNVAIESEEIPDRYALRQNYPNPFNPSTTIQFDVMKASHVSIEVFDVVGRRVAQLVDDELAPGTHSVTFDAHNLASGMYVYRMRAGGSEIINKTMMLLR